MAAREVAHLRGHVVEGADARHGLLEGGDDAEAKVGELERAGVGHQQVLWLDVAVDDAV